MKSLKNNSYTQHLLSLLLICVIAVGWVLNQKLVVIDVESNSIELLAIEDSESDDVDLSISQKTFLTPYVTNQKFLFSKTTYPFSQFRSHLEARAPPV
ncbi:hypothetical protein H0A36_25280 [Endozoicomonas sp. SM1973]|uniref:Uncharacterized protein n=1 Tax=Spartinivicinus marinus TaxID=2994442 RepID=A0A853INC7_9GAMM|nr:hypothetical protein [Spartinivicinus marinus]MCX4027585.1 hypothetical protein [Spartinivicinus marinus]NYZ69336.1 hypothetical protein [Spartinivicinus marinus]